MKNVWLFMLTILLPGMLSASTKDTTALENQQEYSEEELMGFYQQFIDSIEQTLEYEHGEVTIGENIALLQVPEGFKYLNGKDSEMMLTEVWGNPPSAEGDKSLGMILPADKTPNSDTSYVINITYSEEGFIDDSDARDLDYDDLLETMKSDVEEANAYRAEQGYPTAELIGWASNPFYDEANKKLHWAKEIKFEDVPENTLNYNIRVLGRRGYLELNVIGGMPVLEEVKNQINPILEGVNFKDGHRYIDFDPDLDKVAAVGIGGLIAGKVLMKAGILAKIGIVLAKFWKVIAIGFVAFGAGIRKLFMGKKKEEEGASTV